MLAAVEASSGPHVRILSAHQSGSYVAVLAVQLHDMRGITKRSCSTTFVCFDPALEATSRIHFQMSANTSFFEPPVVADPNAPNGSDAVELLVVVEVAHGSEMPPPKALFAGGEDAKPPKPEGAPNEPDRRLPAAEAEGGEAGAA